MIQLNKRGGAFEVSEEQIDLLSSEFKRQHCVRLAGLVAPELLEFVQRELERAEFFEDLHHGISRELHMQENSASRLLHFLTNNPGFLGIVRRITGCQQAVAFGGRVYCMRSDGGHHDNWHDDIHPAEGRLVGMSINLSQRPFAGGLFQLRERATGNFLREIANTGSGDAILFRISDQLQHRVSKVEGEVPKFAFAGWFCSNVNNYFRALQNTRG